MADAERCGNCRFFLDGPITGTTLWKEASGMCRRYAPQGPTIAPNISGGCEWALFPPMASWNWCGDYRPANKAVDDIKSLAA